MRWLWLSLGVLGLSALTAYYFTRPRDISSFLHFTQPHLQRFPSQKVLAITLVGDPNETSKKAGSILYGEYYKLKKNEQFVYSPVMRARWPLPLQTPRNQWIGHYALPVGEQTTTADGVSNNSIPVDGKPYLTTWEYGDYVQILHSGPYATEAETVKHLADFVHSQGKEYEPGTHEEEYLIGPGLFGKGDENEYKTLIRYKIK